jgi:putative membrane protein
MTNSTAKIFKSVAAGALAGLVGAWTMNQFQALLSRLSESNRQPEQPPSEEESDDATMKTAQAISQNVFHHALTREEKKWAGPVVHYGFGASLGAIYGALAETCPITTTGFGTTYGTAVWAVADELAVPAFGLSKPIPETEASSHVSALASHLVYGIATHFARRGLLKLAS